MRSRKFVSYKMKTNSIDTNGVCVTPISKHKKFQGFHRSKSEACFNLDWNKIDEKYSKLGRNGYTSQELEDHVKHLSLNGIHDNGALPMYLDLESGDKNSEKTFAGRRNVLDPSSLQEKQILSRKGSIRGFKNRVRAGINTFLRDDPESTVRMIEKIVFFGGDVGGVAFCIVIVMLTASGR